MAHGVSVQKTGSGKFRAQVRNGPERRFTASYSTEAEALHAGSKLLMEMGTVDPDAPGGAVYLYQLLRAHLAQGTYAPTTLADYERVASKLPTSMSFQVLTRIDAGWLTKQYRTLRHDGWSAHRVAKLHNLISSAYGTAILFGWADANPARDARLERPQNRRTGQGLDVDDVRRVIELAGKVNRDLPTYIKVALNSGARRGEMVALRWENVDASSIWIAESLSETKAGLHQGGTKTGHKGRRRVPLPAALMSELEGLRREGPYVFSHDDGHTPWRPSYVTRAWTRLAKGTGIRVHDLRHIQATHLLKNGVPLHEVAGKLGHTNPNMTLRVYAHAVPANAEDVERFAL